MKLSIIFKSAAVVGVLALGFATNANAATNTATINISTTVPASCLIAAAPLVFANYSGTQVNNQTNLTVTCTNTTTYTIALNPGATSGTSVNTRQMLSGPNTLNYALFSDAGLTKNWGQTTGTDTVAGTGTGLAQTVPVYGQIAGGQNAVPGNYTDQVVATITY
jgi:spore coat protein U-like protein